jgi:hypothetical protein
VESKVRLLVSQLENKPYIELAHVNPNHYPPLNPDKDCCISRWFIGLSFEKAGRVCLVARVEDGVPTSLTLAQRSIYSRAYSTMAGG